MKKSLLITCLILFIGEFLVPYILSIFIKDYSHTKTVLSAIGTEKSIIGKLYSGWLVIAGVLCIVYAILLLKINADSLTNYIKFAAGILILYGIGGCIICGLFSVDQTSEMVSLSAKIHGASAALSFTLLMFLPLILKEYTASLAGNIGTVISIIAFILCALFFVLQIISEKEKFANTCIGYTGLWERMYLFSIYAYITYVTVLTTKG